MEAEIQWLHSQQVGKGEDKGKEDLGKSEHLLRGGFNSMGHLESHHLGHIILSPPFSVSAGRPYECYTLCYTEDWALIEMDPSKIDASFNGNAINLEMHSLIPRHSII